MKAYQTGDVQSPESQSTSVSDDAGSGPGRGSLRKMVDAKCRDCTWDSAAKGTWRQQVTLCSAYDCQLWSRRPVTKRPIPDSVFDYYSVPAHEQEELKRVCNDVQKGALRSGKGKPRCRPQLRVIFRETPPKQHHPDGKTPDSEGEEP